MFNNRMSDSHHRNFASSIPIDVISNSFIFKISNHEKLNQQSTTYRSSRQRRGTFDINGGKKVAKATLATSESFFNKNGDRVENTDWHNLVAWGKTAELMANLGTKGSKIAISGKITNRSYEDKEGVKKYVTEVIVDEFLLMNSKAKAPF